MLSSGQPDDFERSTEHKAGLRSGLSPGEVLQHFPGFLFSDQLLHFGGNAFFMLLIYVSVSVNSILLRNDNCAAPPAQLFNPEFDIQEF